MLEAKPFLRRRILSLEPTRTREFWASTPPNTNHLAREPQTSDTIEPNIEPNTLDYFGSHSHAPAG